MRIVIDMQGAQAENRNRGIGRYTMSLVRAILQNKANHHIVLVLNGQFSESVEIIRAAFENLIHQQDILVWYGLTPVAQINNKNDKRREISEITYEAFLANQNPDFIYVTSLFEGLIDDAITSIHKLQQIAPVAVTIYDLIPFINPKPYLDNPNVKSWYLEKIEYLKKADLWFAISESSRKEGLSYLKLPEKFCINISSDVNDIFNKIDINQEKSYLIREKYGIKKPFIMYTGGIDYRKNIEGLIRAYAQLPDNIRQQHQLAIICSIQSSSREVLESLALKHGLNSGELILTGYVPDKDLIQLYNLCKLFVFPSWHEGFGMPALEAIRCGVPVIGANASSLPEVIGWNEALFDPYSDDDMANAIIRGLTDDVYRAELLKKEFKHAKQFSWNESAKRVLCAMEKYYAEKIDYKKSTTVNTSNNLPRLAYVSPLPSARSGIADYSIELLPELAKFYDIEVIVEQEEIVEQNKLTINLPIRTSKWLLENKKVYDRVIYHFGNSSFHQYMFDLLDNVPGVIVQHDFFLSGIQAHRDVHGFKRGAWANALYYGHGYQAVYERFTAKDTADIVWKYPTNLQVLQRAKGVIVHSEHSRELAKKWINNKSANDWCVIPHLRVSIENLERENARKALGYEEDALLICAFGVLGPTKLNHRLLDAWLNSPLIDNPKAYLIFVGQGGDDLYTQSLLKTIKKSKHRNQIKITGWASTDIFRKYLSAADIGVQLRTMSRGETSGTVLDCMNYGLATIVNAHGSMADLHSDGVWMLSDEFTDDELIIALSRLAEDKDYRKKLSNQAQNIIRTEHEPVYCAEKYFYAIENFYKKSKSSLDGVIEKLESFNQKTEDMMHLATVLAKNFPHKLRPKQLLVDISELVQRDAKSGIQRVVRAILKQWLKNPPIGFQVQPIYAIQNESGYRYASRFTCQYLGIPDIGLDDVPVDAYNGDVFIGLDLQPTIVPQQKEYLHEWRNRGVNVWFVVYDLLPVLQPNCFYPEAELLHGKWLSTIAEFDGVACISESVANEFESWETIRHVNNTLRHLKNKWFHLGADVSASVPSTGIMSDALKLLNVIKTSISFLMVGTIEPRKGYCQVIDSFEQLWGMGGEFKLIIIGKQGWMVESLVQRLHNHPEKGKRLFWLEGISDEYLEKIYDVSTCLIAASYGEGFGLPLIEAAQHQIPIIARDIPVFREVAGDNAFYFDAKDPDELASAIQDWLVLYEKNEYPTSVNMPWLTWEQSADQLLKIILDQP